MSNSLAIASATATLRSILELGVTADAELNDTIVTILPLDKARGAISSNQLNIFLYQVLRSPAWSNAQLPWQGKPGESGNPPLALTLYYLLTAFGRDNDASQPFGHELIGKAMSVLHDHPILSAEDIKAASASLPTNDLDRQPERIRVTPHPITLDELSKLWTGFATQYRLSAAYEVGVVLIESTRPARAPLPVLTRGPEDAGIGSQPDLMSRLPQLKAAIPPGGQDAALALDKVRLTGANLAGAGLAVRFDHPLWDAPVERPVEPGATATELAVTIPDEPDAWPPGLYTVAVLLKPEGETARRATKSLALGLAPRITIAPPVQTPAELTVNITTTPHVWPEQRATLLLGEVEILAAPRAAKADPLVFVTAPLPAGSYRVRLRVDGVDTILVDRTSEVPHFAPTQRLELP